MSRNDARHRWYEISPRLTPWWHLARSRDGEVELLRGPELVTGQTYECVQCGVVRVFVRFWDAADRVRIVSLYGFDFDALTPMHGLRCEVLARPILPEAIDVLEEMAPGEACEAAA